MQRTLPVILAVLFLLFACGISFEFFTGRFAARVDSTRADSKGADRAPATSAIAASDAVGERAGATLGKLGESGDVSRTTLPESAPWPEGPEAIVRHRSRAPSTSDSLYDVTMAEPRTAVVPEISIDPPVEDLKIDTTPSLWKGRAQLLPSPMFVRQLSERRGLDIRGGGWLTIDVTKSRIVPVELFKAPARLGASRVVEAKFLDGSEIVNPRVSGFAFVRGMPGLHPGRFEVSEFPPCLNRDIGVNTSEICEVVARSGKLRFRFEPPDLPLEGPAPDFVFSAVYFEAAPGAWKKIVSYNESFRPLGDPNRDGYPDFYVESVTDSDESGVQTILLSKTSVSASGETVQYIAHSTRFKGRGYR